jgi:pre-mRNA-processing factor 40
MHPPQQPYPAKGGAGRGQFLPPQGGDRGGRGGRGREGRGNMDHQEQSAEAAGFHMMMMPPRGGGRGGSILNTDMMEEEGGGGGEYVPKPGAIKPGPTLMYTSPSDAKAAFKAMLDDADMPTYFSWDQAMRVVSVDHRYMALPSLGEKKQAFGEWMHVRKKEEAEEERMRRRRMKEGFYSMLDGCRELAEWAEDYLDSSSSRYKSSSSSSSKPRYSRAEDLLGSDPRWMAVQSASDREDLFYDWLDDIENKAREKERERRRSKLVAFKQLLKKSTPEYITACTSWRRARDKLADEDEYRDLDKIERLEVYSEYIKELEEKEKEGEEEEKKMEKRRERRARDAFTHLLQQHKARGVFHCRTKWREYLPVVQNEAAYLDMLKNTSGSRPKELFYTLLLLTEEDEAEWQELRRKIMTDGGKGEGSSGIEVSADITFDQYYDMVCDRISSKSSNGGGDRGDTGDGDKPVSRVVVKLLYLEKMDPYIKAKQKAKNDLMAVFDRYRDQLSGGDMPWEKVVEVCGGDEGEGGGRWVGVEGIGGDDERREVYAEYWKTRKEEERERERERERESKKERKRRGGGGGRSDRDSEDEVGAWKRKKGAEEDSESEEGEIPT